MSRERLKLVTEFGELRAGMIVVVGCDHCGSSHRGMIMSLDTRWCTGARGNTAFLPCWILHPNVFHLSAGSGPLRVSTNGVRQRKVYRVLDGLEDSDSTEGAQHRPKPARKSRGRDARLMETIRRGEP